MLEWKREKDVLIPTVPGTWKSRYTANADFLDFNGQYLMYYRGTDDHHDRVGVMTCPHSSFDGIHWEDYPNNPIIDVGAPGSFDSENILDPSAVVFNGRVFLYYSAIGRTSSTIGLAVSDDGFRFIKHGSPLLDGRCPEIVLGSDSRLHLFFVRVTDGKGYCIYHAVSDDGISFEIGESPVLSVGRPGEWDSYSVTTPRIFLDRGLYYMVYAGDDATLDDSWRFGLAVSHDLVNWEKYTANPIFSKGEYGDWDDSNIWFGTVEHVAGRYWMWYEGCNHRRGFDDFISVVGTASTEAPYFFIDPEGEGKESI